MSSRTQTAAITQTVLDYFEGWFDGDAVGADPHDGWRIANALWQFT